MLSRMMPAKQWLAAGLLLLVAVPTVQATKTESFSDPVLSAALDTMNEATKITEEGQAWDDEAAAALAAPAETVPEAASSATSTGFSVQGEKAKVITSAEVPEASVKAEVPAQAPKAVEQASTFLSAQPKATTGFVQALAAQPQVLPDVMNSADMESAVENLVLGKAGAGMKGTPMADSVAGIKKLVEELMMPKLIESYNIDQGEITHFHESVLKCGHDKKVGLSAAVRKKEMYQVLGPQHKICRGLEAVFSTEVASCWQTLDDKKAIKKLKCEEFAIVAKRVSDENANINVMKKSGGENADTYIHRITATVCGTGVFKDWHPKGEGYHAGKKVEPESLAMFQDYHNAKEKCAAATQLVHDMTAQCKEKDKKYFDKRRECDNVQDQMDASACERAVLVKDSCEAYSECYNSKVEAYDTGKERVLKEEGDRKVEWGAVKRMQCLLDAFMDGEVTDTEVADCKEKEHDTDHLIIDYPAYPDRDTCMIPDLYPSTPQYKQKEFAPLPALAKGHVAAECIGVMEINTKPAEGSPEDCKCERLTLNGPYSAGPMVRCSKCLDVRRSQEKNSCPDGTKIFSPRSMSDWKTLLNSAPALRDPNWIIDITRPDNGCGDGCTAFPMNSQQKEQRSWKTSDGSPWWLRKDRYDQPSGDYHSNCYLNLWHDLRTKSADDVTFDDDSCEYHSKSYYCQPVILSTTPAKGSPTSCKCEKVELAGHYSPGPLIRCTECLDVSKTLDKNSCPKGAKIFSPATREDFQTFIDSAKPLREPHFIIDITRPAAGCGGCDRHAMNSEVRNQATWRTFDASAWWLRSTKFSSPTKDYPANCYMDIFNTENSDNVQFKNDECFHSSSYYCQPIHRRR